MTLQRKQLWALVAAFVVIVAAIVVTVVAVGGNAVTGGIDGTGATETTRHAPTGPFGKLLLRRLGFATNCSYVASVTLEPGGPALAQYGRPTHEPPTTESPTGPPHHSRTACLYDRYDPGIWYSSMLVLNGQQLHAGAVYTYYVPAPQAAPGTEVTIPPAMKMIATKYYFTCANEHTPAAPLPFDCRESQPDNPLVTLWANFPTCWNGTGLEPTDVEYPTPGEGCPAGFEKRFPLIQAQMSWDLADGTGATFTSGASFEVIFQNFWVQAAWTTWWQLHHAAASLRTDHHVLHENPAPRNVGSPRARWPIPLDPAIRAPHPAVRGEARRGG